MDNILSYYFEDLDISKMLSSILKEKEIKSFCDIDISNIFDKLYNYVKENIDVKDVKVNKAYKIKKTVKFYGNYFIGEKVEIGDNVVIKRPVIIGDNVTIAPNSYIRPYTILANNSFVGFGSEIKESYIFENAKVASNCFVGNSIIGLRSRVGSGTICANRRFDQGMICLKVNGQKIKTNKKYLGTIIGSNTRIGANCTIYPGATIGKNCQIMPQTPIKDFVKSNTLAYVESNIKEKYCDKLELED